MEIKLSLINQKISEDPAGFIAECEERYYAQVRTVADYVRAHYRERPIILLSGPSGSGKTTTAHLLEKLLDESGHETHCLSMDDYFHPMSEQEKELAAAKKLDLESPARVDSALLKEQLQAISEGKTVELPTYNFVTAAREYNGRTLTRKEGEIVILEGIHALNPDVVGLPEEKTVRLYVSVRTRILGEDGSRLHPSSIRLMRRMLRDRVGRGRPAVETLRMFDSVQRGESLYIMPYKPHALFDIDTLIPYEIGIYKKELSAELEKIPSKNALRTILSFLEKSEAMEESLVPQNSLIQEFI